MRLLLVSSLLASNSFSSFANEYALDDAHNHDGTHVEGQVDCGSNYMFPGNVARLGSHSFLILGEDGPNHLLLDHRSGTPPHTYQFILKVRSDESEMATYRKILKDNKVALPAVTTIYFDKTGKQIDRTFFCLHDLKKIFGAEQKSNDAFAKLFPIRATWQKNADFEGAFPIKETIVPDEPLIIDRKDVEIVLYRYLPSYLEQAGFRKMLKAQGSRFTSMLSHAPIKHDELPATAASHASYINSGAFASNGETCSSDYYLKSVRPPKTQHAFLLLAEMEKNKVLASHLYDQSPQNYQTVMSFELTDEQMKLFRQAKQKSKTPILFMPSAYFCLGEVKELLKSGSLKLSGDLHVNTDYEKFKLGQKEGAITIPSSKIKLMVNRTLQSLMNPQAVARDVFGFVDLKTISPKVIVEAAYATNWNFVGRPIEGYQAGRCYLTIKAAKALNEVQKEVSKKGYSLLVFDCYRPQRAVNQFVAWTKDSDTSKQSAFYPDETKKELIKRGYIDAKSGHSRGSTVDLTLIRPDKYQSEKFNFQVSAVSDCRKSKDVALSGQIDMGTTFDCFSELAHTANPAVPKSVRRNRELLKSAMEKQGFANYPKEWWHFVFKDEPYKNDYFDFEVQ